MQEQPEQTPGGRRSAIFAVSDASGETAERIVRSALVQFKEADAEIIVRGQVDTTEHVKAVVQEAAEHNAPIVHTLVSSALRLLMLEECRLHHVEAVDLMGPVLTRLASLLKLSPLQQPGVPQAVGGGPRQGGRGGGVRVSS